MDHIQTSHQLSQKVDRILADPLLLRRLSDRVYQLWLEDLHHQRDRSQRN